ncbi:MAG: glycerophosphodiester phosphodiesterase, partial [Actinobacteria bacterium]|nr:glycerophosphodiester phosphodiesterase [Actinomycetota bacterium]NBR93066.1 glycerophosphodiester phosphodiesterase [Actinomycetota bacterium]
MDSFRLAHRLGATGIESDVWLTRDGVAVLDHDGVVGGRFRRRAIDSTDVADLP